MRQSDDVAARAALDSAHALAPSCEAPLPQLAAIQQAAYEVRTGSIDTALRALDLAFSQGRNISSASVKGHALAAVGCIMVLNKQHNALAIIDRAQLLYERAGATASIARVYNNRGVHYYHNNREHVTAIPYLERALDLTMAWGDLLSLIDILSGTIRVHEDFTGVRAGELRDKMDSFVAILPQAHHYPLEDETATPLPTTVFEQDGPGLYVPDPLILLPIPDPITHRVS